MDDRGNVQVECEGHGERVFSVPQSSPSLQPVMQQVVERKRESLKRRRDEEEAQRQRQGIDTGYGWAAVLPQPAASEAPWLAIGPGFVAPRPPASSGPALGKCGHSRPHVGTFCSLCGARWEGMGPEPALGYLPGQSYRCPHCRHERVPIDASACPWCSVQLIEVKGPDFPSMYDSKGVLTHQLLGSTHCQ